MSGESYQYGVDVCNDPRYECKEINPIGNTTPMEDGRFYESTYSVGGIRSIFPGWEEEAINNIRASIESHPGCYVNYIYMQPNNVVVVQWYYSSIQYAADMRAAGYYAIPAVVPLAAYVVAAAALIVIGLYLTSQIISTIKEILVESKEQVDLITWAVILIAICVLIFAIVYAIKNISGFLPKRERIRYIEG